MRTFEVPVAETISELLEFPNDGKAQTWTSPPPPTDGTWSGALTSPDQYLFRGFDVVYDNDRVRLQFGAMLDFRYGWIKRFIKSRAGRWLMQVLGVRLGLYVRADLDEPVSQG